MPTESSFEPSLLAPSLSVLLAMLLLLALVALTVTAVRLCRTRRQARADALSQQQELTRLRSTRAELERTSYTDALTGVWNYRYLQLALDREIARCSRHSHADGADRLSLLLLEIDGLDEIRREHGHQRGGAVLRDLVQRLAMEVREADVFGRYGGDEFLVLLPDTDAAGAETVAERLRWTVRRHPLALPSVPVLSVLDPASAMSDDLDAERGAAPVNGLSAAVGIAVLPRDGGHAALLLRAADRSLAAARGLRPDRGPRPDLDAGLDRGPCSDAEPTPEADPAQAFDSLLAKGCDLGRKTAGWA
jgi:diguanylate cyclase (GGDEF)-like protein